MATGTDKFLNYNGLVKLIGLIKKRINDAISSIDIAWGSNAFVKSIAGYGTGAAPTSTSGVNDTKNKLEGMYTTGKLDGTGTDVTTNKFTYIDTTYGGATTTKSGLMSPADKTKLDDLSGGAWEDKGASLIGYDKDMFNEMPATVADALDLLNPYIIHVTKNGNRYEYVGFNWQEYQAAFEAGRQIYVYDDTNKRICIPNSQSWSDVKYINFNPNTGIVSDYHVEETGVTVVETNLASVSYITSNYVPTSRTINGTALTSDIVLKSGNINLTSNITVDGTSKGNVQDALTALNTLAAANKSAISTLQSGGLTREVVTALPTGSNIKANVIYMILASNDTLNSGDPSTSATTTPYGTNNNSYNEYMYINNAWERIGSTEVNLDIDPITDDEIDTAWITTVAAA